MKYVNPYKAPESPPDGPPRDPTPARTAGCLVQFVCVLLGLVLGGYYGWRQYQTAVAEDVRRGGPGDYLPVTIPIGACAGAFLGLVAAAIFEGVRVLRERRRRTRGASPHGR